MGFYLKPSGKKDTGGLMNKGVLSILAVLLFAGAYSAKCTTCTEIPLSACQAITAPGNYVLTQDIIIPGPTTCFYIYPGSTNGSITIDCQGHTIRGRGINGDDIGISMGAYPTHMGGVPTIVNCRFDNIFQAMAISVSSGGSVSHNYVRNASYGIVSGNPYSPPTAIRFIGNDIETNSGDVGLYFISGAILHENRACGAGTNIYCSQATVVPWASSHFTSSNCAGLQQLSCSPKGPKAQQAAFKPPMIMAGLPK